jgi:hypothetical protein
MRTTTSLVLLLATTAALAQPARGPSTFELRTTPDGSKSIAIQNVSYHVSQVPGRNARKDERLLIRKTTHFKQILGEKGMEGTVTVEAWPLGSDIRQKALYTVKATGTDGQLLDNSLFVLSRGLEETEWWSVYKLGTGQHLLDTYVPLLSFSISREEMKTRYVGLEVPPDDSPRDDSKDVRLKQPKVIGVLTYASEDRVLHEWLITCDDPKRAQLLRSFSDVTRTLTVGESATAGAQILTLSFRENFPSPPNPVDLIVPVLGDDLDVAHARLPPSFHLTAWRR